MQEEKFQNAHLFDADGDKIIATPQLSLEQQEQVRQAKNQQKQNLIKQQKLGTKIFKGPAFIAKPSTIAFTDFTIGRQHSLTIVLTNVSNAFNSFHVLPLPDKIKNYFEVEYVPKGKISPGITTSINFKFFPQLNDDIFSEFSIMAETGKISFPISCTSKKTIVKCNHPVVDFGRVIFGESGQATLKLRNEGSLPSNMMIQTKSGQNIDNFNMQDNELISQLKFNPEFQIGGKTQKQVIFQYKPTKIGYFSLKLLAVAKNFLHSPIIPFEIVFSCVQVPVRIQKALYDLQICLLSHSYRQKLVFYNKGQTSMSFKLVQENKTRKYFQFNPAIGYIQKQAKIQIWVKFNAQRDLATHLSNFMVSEGIYLIPFQLIVKEQKLPVDFQIKFRVTNERVIIKPLELNFGSVFEGLASKIEVTFQNQSQLPQQILLNPLKKQIYVQNNQPIFKLLPKQILKTFITYRSKKLEEGKPAKDQGSIPCKIITGDLATAEVKLDYYCQTIKPDLHILHNQIDLQALQIGQICTASTMFTNNCNKKIIYEILVPHFSLCGLKIDPVVKQLEPKQKIQVNIQYHSAMRKMGPTTLRDLALQPAKQLQQPKNQEIQPSKQTKKQVKKQTKKQAKKEPKLTKQQQQLEAQQKRKEQEDRLRRQQQQQQQKRQLQASFNLDTQLSKLGGKLFDFGSSQHYHWTLPIYFKKKDYADTSSEVTFIKITSTATEKTLICDQQVLDFGEIAVGGRATQSIYIQNKGQSTLLHKKQLPIFCCFNVLNSLRQVKTNESFKAVIEFQPIQQQKFEHRLIFYTDKYVVSCLLKGKGVRPDVKIQPQSGIFQLGAVLVDQYIEKSFKIKNVCGFPTSFILKKIGCGISNSDSVCAIRYTPMSGTIAGNKEVEIKVKFKPNRISEKYFQKIEISVPEQRQKKFMYIKGSCYQRQAYVCLYREIKMPSDQEARNKLQSPFDFLKIKDEDTVYGPTNKTIILRYQKISQSNKENEKCYKQRLNIGSCKLMDSKLEKPTNFEIILTKQSKFICDNIKGTVSAGGITCITFTYKPDEPDPFMTSLPVLAGMGQWKDFKNELKISGGFMKPGAGQDNIVFDLILRVYVHQL